MKLLPAIAGFALACAVAAGVHAQSAAHPPYKVAFDLTSADPADQQAVLRWISEVKAANPATQTEVVMYGHGLDLVIAEKTGHAADVTKAMSDLHAEFRVCAIAMKNQHLVMAQLVPGVKTVPDGIGELVAKQQAGWGYIKVGH
jgi:intracellular sulfur oxidation DsrE/DsrF family protein